MLVRSELGLREQETALGVTWLDEAPPPSGVPLGFGREVAEAQVKRRAFLAGIGMKVETDAGLSAAQKTELLRRDLAQAGRTLSGEIGKPYSPAPDRGHVGGTYREPVFRVSGKFGTAARDGCVGCCARGSDIVDARAWDWNGRLIMKAAIST